MPNGKKHKRHKMATHKRKKRLRSRVAKGSISNKLPSKITAANPRMIICDEDNRFLIRPISHLHLWFSYINYCIFDMK